MRALLRTPRFLVSALLLTTVAVAWPQAQNQAPAQPPRFKAGVEVMRVELTVLDKQTREPIRGLTAADFVIKVNGQPQEVVAFSEVIIPGDARAGAQWTREAPRDVATNASGPAAEQRLIVIIMDDAVTVPYWGGKGTDLYHRSIGRAAAHRIVDELGPYDLAAILFTQFNQHAQDFTADRTALRRAIETYNPGPLDPRMANAMSLGTLTRVGQFLASIPDRRRAVFYVTIGPGLDTSEDDALGWSDVVQQRIAPMMSEAEVALNNSMRPLIGTSQVAQVPVYPISTRGLEAPSLAELTTGRLSSLGKYDSIRAIADATGGRAVYNTNAPDRQVASLFRELSSYYTLAYAASFPMDGKIRRLAVDVKRAGALVEPDGIVLTTPKAVSARVPASLRTAPASGLIGAIAGPLPSGALPLSLAVAPFAAGRRPAAALTLGITVPASETPPPGGRDQVAIEAGIFDGEGRKQVAQQNLTASVTPSPGSLPLYEVAMRFDLAPGRYNVRVGAAVVGTSLTGGAFSTFTVPNFDKDALSMSGVAIGQANMRPVAGRASIEDILPFAPTVERLFDRTDIVGALVRVHQSSSRAPMPVTLLTTITSDSGALVSRSTEQFDAGRFAATHSVEHRAELALMDLVSGNYLLTFTATTARGVAATRDVRFTVR